MGRSADRRWEKNSYHGVAVGATQQNKTIRSQEERQLAVQYAVSCLLLEARSLDEVAFKLLHVIGHDLTWDVGLLWVVDREKDAMCCHTIWQAPSHTETVFEQVSRRIAFPKGIGLPGQVWTAQQPLWCSDILEQENFPRHEAAAMMGLHTALAFPIRGHSGVLGVMEFYSQKVLPPDAGLLRTVITLGQQFGQFLERLRAEETVRTSEIRKAAILQTALDAIIMIDQCGIIIEWNPAAERLFGYSRREAIGQEIVALIIPSTLHSRYTAGFARYLAAEEAHGLKQRVEITLLRANGQEFPANVSGAPLYDLEKGITGGVCVFRDVSERRSLDHRVSDALEALLSMAEALMYLPEEADPDSQDTTDGVQVPDEINAVVKRLAYLAYQVLGCQHLNILTLESHSDGQHDLLVVGAFPEQLDKQYVNQRYTLPGILDFPFVRRLQAKEVQVLDMEQPLFNTLPNPHNVPTILLAPMCIREALVGVLTLDYGQTEHEYTAGEKALAQATANFAALVLERQRLLQEQAQARVRELALFESKRRMDEFLSIASHELKTPLTAVIGNIEVLEMLLSQMVDDVTSGTKQGDKVQKTWCLLQRAQPQLWRLNRLIDELLDVSRIQVNKLALLMESCDLVTIVQQEIVELRQINPTRTITLKIEVEGAIPIYAHADRISQVVTNYITNALKYSADDKAVAVVLQKKEGVGCCAVYDQGMGLSPDEQDRIWERFYRVQSNAYRNGSSAGLGLGLYINRTVIEQHQGQVGVQSTPGAGACFWFALPLVTA